MEEQGFKKNLSLQEACNEVALNTLCNCIGDCSTNGQCSCKVAGTFCTLLCNSEGGKNAPGQMKMTVSKWALLNNSQIIYWNAA